MINPWILAGHAAIDKLPYWVAVPAGVVAGFLAGHAASTPDAGSMQYTVLGLVFLAVVVFGMFAPRPARRGPHPNVADVASDPASRSLRTDAFSGGSSTPADDSLCD